MVLFSPLRDLASDLRQELSPGAINLVWHRQWAGTVHEPATDALILNTPDPVDTTAVVRRVTASPTLVVGGTPSEAVTCLELGADSWLPADAPVRLIAAQLRRLALRFPRIVRLRPDKPPEEADTVEKVEEIYLSQHRATKIG